MIHPTVPQGDHLLQGASGAARATPPSSGGSTQCPGACGLLLWLPRQNPSRARMPAVNTK